MWIVSHTTPTTVVAGNQLIKNIIPQKNLFPKYALLPASKLQFV
jgi:hypothetical protein